MQTADACFSPLLGDYDCNCDVDILDVMQVASRWGSHAGDPRYAVPYDLNQDNRIDSMDIEIMGWWWRRSCGDVVLLRDTDWSDGHYTAVDDVDPEASPGELLLRNDPSRMVFAFDPTPWALITDAIVYRGRLYLLACEAPDIHTSGDVIEYDYATDTYRKVYTVDEQGIVRIYDFNDRLYIPGEDATESWAYGNFYTFDGQSWQKHRTIPKAVHVNYMAYYKGQLFTTAARDVGGPGLAPTLYVSADDGETWNVDVDYGKQPGVTISPLTVFADKLLLPGIFYDYNNDHPIRDGWLFLYDGVQWRSRSGLPWDRSLPRTFTVYRGRLYAASIHGLFVSTPDGEDFQAVDALGDRWFTDLAVHNDQLFVGEFGDPFSTLYASTDGVQWTAVASIPSSLTSSGRPATQKELALESYEGRLYAGAAGEGKVYVSAAQPSGSLVSLARQVNPIPPGAQLIWDAITPPGTVVRFQIRTGASLADLTAASFVGPDGTTTSYYDVPGSSLAPGHEDHTWFQYQVFLSTTDPAKTPYLREVALTSQSLSILLPMVARN